MAQQVPDRHVLDCPEAVTHFAQLGNVLDDGIVEGEQSAIAQLHDGDRGKGLGDRGPMEDRVRVYRAGGLDVGQTVEVSSQHRVSSKDHQSAPHDPLGFEGSFVEGPGFGPGPLECGASLGFGISYWQSQKPASKQEDRCDPHMSFGLWGGIPE